MQDVYTSMNRYTENTVLSIYHTLTSVNLTLAILTDIYVSRIRVWVVRPTQFSLASGSA